MRKQNNTVSKPQPFIAPGSEKKLTPEEINKRKIKFERLEKIGEKHPHYVYFAKKACRDDIVLY